MSAHTAGPWRRRSIPGHIFEISNASGEIVLRIRGGMMPTLPDARLLSAAPDMLRALDTLARAAASRENTMGDPIDLLNAKAELRAAIEDARNVIAALSSEPVQS
jgi:hypothetical protein